MIIPKFLLQRLWVKGSLQRTTANSLSFQLENPFLLGHLVGIEALSINNQAVDLATLQVDGRPVETLTTDAPLAINHKQQVVFGFAWEAHPIPTGKVSVGLTANSKETGSMSVVLEDTLSVAI
jgi:hypothetical protein